MFNKHNYFKKCNALLQIVYYFLVELIDTRHEVKLKL